VVISAIIQTPERVRIKAVLSRVVQQNVVRRDVIRRDVVCRDIVRLDIVRQNVIRWDVDHQDVVRRDVVHRDVVRRNVVRRDVAAPVLKLRNEIIKCVRRKTVQQGGIRESTLESDLRSNLRRSLSEKLVVNLTIVVEAKKKKTATPFKLSIISSVLEVWQISTTGQSVVFTKILKIFLRTRPPRYESKSKGEDVTKNLRRVRNS